MSVTTHEVGFEGLDALGGVDALCLFVAEDDRQRMRIVAGHHVQVAVTHAVGHPANEHLVRTGLHDVDVFHGQRLLHLVHHGGFGPHRCLL